MLTRAASLGTYGYWCWGGEPLLREDTPDILAHSHKLGIFNMLSTNCSKLKDRYDELLPYTDIFSVSMDGIGRTHDKTRGYPGLFDKVVEGIEILRRNKGRVRIFYVVNSMNADEIEDAVKLAKELKVSINAYPIMRFAGWNEELMLDREKEREIFSKLLSLQKQGYPVVTVRKYLKIIRDGKQTKCLFPRYFVYVDWDGEIYNCSCGRLMNPLGNIRNIDLEKLYESEDYKRKVKELEQCNRCRTPAGELGGAGSLFRQFPERYFYHLKHEKIHLLK